MEKARIMTLSDLQDIRLPVTVELDRLPMPAKELTALKVGDVVTLPRAAGELTTVYIGNILFGWGEIILTDRSLSVRVADLREVRGVPSTT